MATARRGRSDRPRILGKLPTPAETAAEIQSLARRLGLLLDLHRVTSRLRDLDSTKAARSSN
jgi:hypothetical protein